MKSKNENPREAATSTGARKQGNFEQHSSNSADPAQEHASTHLSDAHCQMLRTDSGLSEPVIAARGYRTITTKAELRSLGFSEAQRRVPALLIPIHSVFGEIALHQARPDYPRIKDGKAVKYDTVAGHRMVLDCHPTVRHDLENPKVPLWITEGVKKGDSLVSRGCCSIALLGVWNWRGMNEHGGKTLLADWEAIALNDRPVYIVFDSDVMTKREVHGALVRLKAFIEQRGGSVRIVYLPPGLSGAKMGVDDFLASGRTVQHLILLSSADLRPLPQKETSSEEPGLPMVEIAKRHMRDISDDAVRALQKANAPPELFRRGNALVRLLTNQHQLHADPFTVHSLKGRLDRVADFMRTRQTKWGDEDTIPARPPTDVVQDILTAPDPPFPILSGIATVPVFMPDGTLLSQEGYDPESGLYLRLREVGTFRSDMPLEEARSFLVEDLFGDFPFVGDAGCAHTVCLLLQRFVRQMIPGPSPLFLIHAPQRGTGKGLLADVVSLITLGHPAPVMALTRDEAETEKRVTALLMAGAQLILLDNVTALRSTSLTAVLTANEWQGRILGRSQMVMVPNQSTWLATGNNVELSDEMVRRVIPIRLDAGVERPEERSGFRHENLPLWVKEHRSELVSACLSLIQAWTLAGKKGAGHIFGRYEGWAAVMGGILEVSGIHGFLGDRESLYRDSDRETQEWAAFCAAWYESYGEHPVTAKDLFEVAKERGLLLDLWGGRSALAAQQRLGHALSARRDRMYSEYRIYTSGRDAHTGNSAYRVERVAKRVATRSNATPETPETLETPSELRNGGGVSGVSGDPRGTEEELIDLVD